VTLIDYTSREQANVIRMGAENDAGDDQDSNAAGAEIVYLNSVPNLVRVPKSNRQGPRPTDA
jgi:hypothetical protein